MSEKNEVKLGGRVSGNLTLRGTKKSMNQSVKEAIVAERDDGKIRMLQKVLIDPETGAQVVLKGKIRISSNGNLTAFVNFTVENVECVLEDAPAQQPVAAKPKFDADAVAEKLLGV